MSRMNHSNVNVHSAIRPCFHAGCIPIGEPTIIAIHATVKLLTTQSASLAMQDILCVTGGGRIVEVGTRMGNG